MSGGSFGMRFRSWSLSCLCLALLLLAYRHLLTGSEVFFFRDLSTTHGPSLELFSRLGFAKWNAYASFDEPYLGNPNLLIAYPFPKGLMWLSLHVLAHLVISLTGVIYLLRNEGTSSDAAWFGATTFAFSGYLLSASSTLNSLTTLSWLPWLLALAEKRRMVWWGIPLAALFLLSGEPVLIGFGIVLAFTRVVMQKPAMRQLARLALVFAVAGLLTAPVHLATFREAGDSFRVLQGYVYDDASAEALHPARLLEMLVPFLYGRPDRIVRGAFWGFRQTWGRPVYIYSVAISVTALALLLGHRRLRYPQKAFWTGVALVSLAFAIGGRSPLAHWLYDHLPLFRVVRFPIKCFAITTLAVSVLSAHCFDAYLVKREPIRFRWQCLPLLLGAGVLMLLAVATMQLPGAVFLGLRRYGWDSSWVADPHAVLEPIVSALPARLLAVAVILILVTWALLRQRGTLHIAALQLLCVTEGISLASVLLPTVSADNYRVRSPLVRAAVALHGRIYERAGKDLEGVRLGVAGSYASDDVRSLAAAQARQGWSLSGAAAGMRYAFDKTPDGSYTERNERVRELVDEIPWDRRVAFLRSEGVVGIISPPFLSPPRTVREVVTDRAIGVPCALYAITGALPEVRRVDRAIIANTEAEAIAALGRPSFDPMNTIVVEPRAAAAQLPVLDVGRSDTSSVVTSSAKPGWLFLARTFVGHMNATVNGRRAPVYPANVHAIAIPVPAGNAEVEIVK